MLFFPNALSFPSCKLFTEEEFARSSEDDSVYNFQLPTDYCSSRRLFKIWSIYVEAPWVDLAAASKWVRFLNSAELAKPSVAAPRSRTAVGRTPALRWCTWCDIAWKKRLMKTEAFGRGLRRLIILRLFSRCRVVPASRLGKGVRASGNSTWRKDSISAAEPKRAVGRRSMLDMGRWECRPTGVQRKAAVHRNIPRQEWAYRRETSLEFALKYSPSQRD